MGREKGAGREGDLPEANEVNGSMYSRNALSQLMSLSVNFFFHSKQRTL